MYLKLYVRMAATTKNKNKNSNVEVFPPSDRELALRGK